MNFLGEGVGIIGWNVLILHFKLYFFINEIYVKKHV